MQKKFTQLFTLILVLAVGQLTAQRYLSPITADITKTENVEYGSNITVITGAPVDTALVADIYMPTTDDVTDRPLVIYAHTGSFLPRGTNGGTTGEKDDYAVQKICGTLASMGYVAAAISYRKGWNPLDTTAELRRRGLINAAYRGVQDFRSAVRFFKKDVAEGGNTYGIDPDRIAGWGQGTGGYIVLGAATLQQDEIYIPKFQDPITGASFIDTTLIGDVDGLKPGAISKVNTPGYSSDFHFAFEHGGAMGDSSWLDEAAPPIAAAHILSDPFAPFYLDPFTGERSCEGPVIVPTTQEFVVNVAGPYCFVDMANNMGVNDILITDAVLDDPVNQTVAGQNFAEDNLYTISVPGFQSGVWDYWDSTFWKQSPHPSPNFDNFHQASSATNPDMSMEKADAYIDTLVRFFAPRAYAALALAPVKVGLSFEAKSTRYSPAGFGNASFGPIATAVIDNPDQGGDNNSDKVLSLTKDAGAQVWAGASIKLDEPLDNNQGPVFSMWVWSPKANTPFLFKVEDTSSPPDGNGNPSIVAEVQATGTVANAWEKLYFDLSDWAAYDPANTYDQVVVFPDFGNTGADETFYVDEINYDQGVGTRDIYPNDEFFNVYPNPVNDVLQIAYKVETSNDVSFTVVNVLGRTVYNSNSQRKLAGDHIDQVPVNSLANGVYYLLLNIDGQSVSKRVFVKD